MKSKIVILSLAGLVASAVAVMAQTDAAATDKGTNAPVADAAPAVTSTNAAPAAAAPAAAAPAVAADAATAATNAVAPTAGTTSTNAATRDPNAPIPLIVMDEVPLTDAIKNLARQAGLNYMLDPKINYGAPGANGAPATPQPLVTLRWENLTPDQALGAVLQNYNLTIVDDPRTKIARITVKDPAAPDPLTTKIVQLKYAYATNLVTSVQTVLQDKRSKVLADVRTSQLVVVATEKEMVAVDELISRLDTITKQVLIEAKLIETTKNPNSTKGIDWSGTLQAQHVTFGNHALPGIPPTPPTTALDANGNPVAVPGSAGTIGGILSDPKLIMSPSAGSFFNPATAFLNADGVSAVLSFLNTEADAQVLSTPKAVTLDNEEAVLQVVTAQPIFATTAGTQGSPGGSQVTYTNVGTILHVTPRISANNRIALKVIPEVSDIGGTVTKTVAGVVNQADFFNVRRVETQVLIPSGNTLVMGGLLDDSRHKGYTKVPGLGDIPVLGWAFRSEAKEQNKRNLLIFVTPTIVQDEDFQPTQSDFLKNKVTASMPSDLGPWNNGAPQDWSKLMSKNPPDWDEDTNAK